MSHRANVLHDVLKQVVDDAGLVVHKTKNIGTNLGMTPIMALAVAFDHRLRLNSTAQKLLDMRRDSDPVAWKMLAKEFIDKSMKKEGL